MEPPDRTIAALLLAGGRASRMGGIDKPMALLAGEPLAAHVLRRLASPERACAISANGDISRFARFGLVVLRDADDSFSGPLAGVLAGLDWAAALGATHLLTAPVDCPFLPDDLAEHLSAAPPQRIAHARAGGRDHPTIALWPLSCRNPLRTALAAGERRMMAFLARMDAQAVDWTEDKAFFNVNTPDDLALAQTLYDQRAKT